jgi:hypothetical protein
MPAAMLAAGIVNACMSEHCKLEVCSGMDEGLVQLVQVMSGCR